jgi:hypothetical protein
MKRWLAFLLAILIGCAGLAACSEAPSPSLTGLWVCETTVLGELIPEDTNAWYCLSFSEDGTGVETHILPTGTHEYPFTYTAADGVLTLSMTDGGGAEFTYKLDSDGLHLTANQRSLLLQQAEALPTL